MAPIVVRIVEAVADARGETAGSLNPLGSYFEVEALERIIDSTTVPTKVAIEFEDCTVVVDGDGNVAVNPDDTL